MEVNMFVIMIWVLKTFKIDKHDVYTAVASENEVNIDDFQAGD